MGHPLKKETALLSAIFLLVAIARTVLNGLANCPNRPPVQNSPGEFPYVTAAFAEYWYLRAGASGI